MAQQQRQPSGQEEQAKPVVEETKGIQVETESGAKGIERKTAAPIGRHERFGGAELWASPFSFVQRMMEEMDRVFGGVGGGLGPSVLAPINVLAPLRTGAWSPVIETFEQGGRIFLRAELPGLEKKDVKVEIEGDELVIAGERTQVEREKTEGRYYSERHYGCFERRMTLPVGCDPDTIEASFDNGVLEVSLAAPEQKAKTKKIEIRSGQGSEGGPRSVH